MSSARKGNPGPRTARPSRPLIQQLQTLLQRIRSYRSQRSDSETPGTVQSAISNLEANLPVTVAALRDFYVTNETVLRLPVLTALMHLYKNTHTQMQ